MQAFSYFLIVSFCFSVCLCKDRGLYVDVFDSILGNSTAESFVISFALSHNFTYLCLYDIGLILDSGRSNELANFIKNAKAQGVQEIGAAGGWTGHFDLFASYQTKFANDSSKQLDVFNLESEFWNNPNVTTAFAKWLSLAAYMKKKAGTKKIEAYLGQSSGVITKTRLASIVKVGFSRLFLSCYSSNSQIGSIMNNCQGVYDNLNAALGTTVSHVIYPLFSVEPDFFGGNININQVEQNFTTSFTQRYGTNTGMKMNGFMFFAYTEFTS